MRLVDLFVVPAESRAGRDVDLFSAPQSLTVFPVATCLVATITRAARTLARADAESTVWVALTAALGIGCALFLTTVTDPRTRPRTLREGTARALAAGINSLLLCAAALGIEKF
jgi:hypothetical protein